MKGDFFKFPIFIPYLDKEIYAPDRCNMMASDEFGQISRKNFWKCIKKKKQLYFTKKRRT